MSFEIVQDDVLHALQDFERRGEKFDCVVMDPPYCSGGAFTSTISKNSEKYCRSDKYLDFFDGLGQLALFRFLCEIFFNCRNVLKSPGYLFCFTDWRIYPIVSEAFMRGQITSRGVLVWNKMNSRINPGQFRNDCEFIFYGTAGSKKNNKFLTSNVISCRSPLSCTRIHPTQKPEKVYAHLYNILEDGARILELFSGSASGGVAAIHNGFDYIGVESSPFYVASSRKRLRDELARKDFLDPKQTKKESKKEETPLLPFDEK